MRLPLVLIALLLLLPATAEAKVKPLTYKQAIGQLVNAANDLQASGEEVLDGDCQRPVGRREADCYLLLARSEETTFGKACLLSITVTKDKKGRLGYSGRYANPGVPHMRAYCTP